MLITEMPIWNLLKDHYKKVYALNMNDLFKENPKRLDEFSIKAPQVFLDYSKNKITKETLGLLFKLADEVKLKEKIEDMFLGKKINVTENREVLHTALRDSSDDVIEVDGVNIKTSIRNTLNKMQKFSEDIHEKRWLGFSGKAITDVVNIGIGGSDLGPKIVCKALSFYGVSNIKCHFVSNVDSTDIVETLKSLNPETTIFCVASKTFTTIETMTNAETAKKWILDKFKDEVSIEKHFVAVSSNVEKAREFGISENNVFEFWNWVSGRFSVWSAIGLPIVLLIGIDRFKEFLIGAYEIDNHFRNEKFEKNAPVILALLEIWYRNFFDTSSYAVIPYDEYLEYFPDYLQQLNMESNGKSVDIDGNEIDYKTAPVTWGNVGTNGQHAFHQLFHQGTDLIPIDFIIALKSLNPVGRHHDLLFANCLAQSQALLKGKSYEEAYQELLDSDYSKDKAKILAHHKMMKGNRSSNTLVIDKLTPKSLGALIALYEHKVFVEGVIWNINSFDQFGVELGKKLAENIVKCEHVNDCDSSTVGLLRMREQQKHKQKKVIKITSSL